MLHFTNSCSVDRLSARPWSSRCASLTHAWASASGRSPRHWKRTTQLCCFLSLSSKMSKISEGAISADGANGGCHQRNCERERRRLAGASPPATLHPKTLSVDPAGSCKISAWQRLFVRQRFSCATKRTAVSLAVTSTYCLEQPTSLCSSLPRSEAPGEAPPTCCGVWKVCKVRMDGRLFFGSIGLLHHLQCHPPINNKSKP